MIEDEFIPADIKGIIANPCYAPLVVGAGIGVEGIKTAMALAKDKGVNIVIIGEPDHRIPEELPQELFLKKIELELKSLQEYQYSDCKDGKASRRERRAKERKAKRYRTNGA